MFMKYKKTPPEKSGRALARGGWKSLIWKRSIKIKNQKVLIYSIKFLSLDMYVGSIPPLLYCRTIIYFL